MMSDFAGMFPDHRAEQVSRDLSVYNVLQQADFQPP